MSKTKYEIEVRDKNGDFEATLKFCDELNAEACLQIFDTDEAMPNLIGTNPVHAYLDHMWDWWKNDFKKVCKLHPNIQVNIKANGGEDNPKNWWLCQIKDGKFLYAKAKITPPWESDALVETL